MGRLGSRPPLRRLAILLLLAAAACGDSSGPATTTGSPSATEGGLLFVLGAPGARLERDARGTGRLVLQDPSPSVTSFTDRPERSASTLALADFVGGWTRYGFTTTPPNAALVVEAAPESADVAVLELSSPRLESGALTFDVTPLAGSASAGVRALAERADPALPTEIGRVALFVDAALVQTVYAQVVLQVANAVPGQTIVVTASSNDTTIAWSMGPPLEDASGLGLTCESGVLPLSSLQITEQQITLTTADAGSDGASALAFTATAYLAASYPVSTFSLRSDSDAGIFVTASIAGSEPQVVGAGAATLFAWP